MLMLMFGVIEFARIFQAWVTLQNSARAAARYAITGQWDEQSVIDVLKQKGYTAPSMTNEEALRAVVLDELVPCTTGTDQVFLDHWGHDCVPGDEDDEGLRQDLARIPSVVERARIGAAGLSLEPGDNYVGLKYKGVDLNTETVNSSQKGWFHVWMCSSRPPVYNAELKARYKASSDRNERLCGLQEGPTVPNPLPEDYDGDNQYDAGGPGDAIEVIVFFNHPLITPLGLVDYIQIQARRVMINESFRSSRVVNLPPQLAQPTFTPSKTPLPSNTPKPSETPLPTWTYTFTPTNAPTETQTPTPTPDCSLVQLDSVRLVDNYLQITIRNSNTYSPVFLTQAKVYWTTSALYPDMYWNQAAVTGRNAFWSGRITASGTTITSSTAGWVNDPPEYLLRRIDNATTTTVQFRFLNGPTQLSSAFTVNHFGGTTLYFGTGWGGSGATADCVVTMQGYPTPTPPSQTPTRTPTPVCGNFVVNFVSFETNGVVHFSITNNDVVVRQITGFTINWNTYNRTLNNPVTLDFISVGGASAFDPAAVVIWDGTQTTTPFTGTASPRAALEPGQSKDIWLDFDGTSGRLDSIGYYQSDFNGVRFVVDAICNTDMPDVNTPAPTQPPTATLTRTFTYTPSPITPSATSPTNTPTPVTPTKTKTNTYTPSPTKSSTVPPTATDVIIGG